MRKYQRGEKVWVNKKFSVADLEAFSKLSLDTNPLHLEADFAARSVFGKRIVHGMLVSSLFSGLLGMQLPGEGSIYLGQSLKFLAPVFIGEEVRATCEIISVREDKPIITLRTFCEKMDGTMVIDGEVVVKVPR